VVTCASRVLWEPDSQPVELRKLGRRRGHGGPAVIVTVSLHVDDNELRFELADDGPGFHATDGRGGAGLENMHDRLGTLDGRLSIVSAPGAGTVVRARPGWTRACARRATMTTRAVRSMATGCDTSRSANDESAWTAHPARESIAVPEFCEVGIQQAALEQETMRAGAAYIYPLMRAIDGRT
jgi:hypothetical protein